MMVKKLSTLLFTFAFLEAATATAAPYRVLGQPDLNSTTLATRCAAASARFNFNGAGAFQMYGPSGIAIDPRDAFPIQHRTPPVRLHANGLARHARTWLPDLSDHTGSENPR